MNNENIAAIRNLQAEASRITRELSILNQSMKEILNKIDLENSKDYLVIPRPKASNLEDDCIPCKDKKDANE